nr:WRKY protein [Ipomoea batatas]
MSAPSVEQRALGDRLIAERRSGVPKFKSLPPPSAAAYLRGRLAILPSPTYCGLFLLRPLTGKNDSNASPGRCLSKRERIPQILFQTNFCPSNRYRLIQGHRFSKKQLNYVLRPVPCSMQTLNYKIKEEDELNSLQSLPPCGLLFNSITRDCLTKKSSQSPEASAIRRFVVPPQLFRLQRWLFQSFITAFSCQSGKRKRRSSATAGSRTKLYKCTSQGLSGRETCGKGFTRYSSLEGGHGHGRLALPTRSSSSNIPIPSEHRAPCSRSKAKRLTKSAGIGRFAAYSGIGKPVYETLRRTKPGQRVLEAKEEPSRR